MSMTIAELIAKSGDAILGDYCYSNGVLKLRLDLSDPEDARVSLSVKTSVLVINVPLSEEAPHRTCHIEILELLEHLDCDDRGIFVPPSDDAVFMRQVRGGLSLAFGYHRSRCGQLFQLRSSQTLLACVLRDRADISCEIDHSQPST